VGLLASEMIQIGRSACFVASLAKYLRDTPKPMGWVRKKIAVFCALATNGHCTITFVSALRGWRSTRTHPGSALRFCSPHTIIFCRYSSLYVAALSNFSRSRP
jgi:hypothetical protein